MRLDEWLVFQFIPFNGEVQNFYISLPLISHFHRFRRAAESDSFPSGEAKGCKTYAFTIQRTALFLQVPGGGKAADGSTTSRPLQWGVPFNRVLAKIRGFGHL